MLTCQYSLEIASKNFWNVTTNYKLKLKLYSHRKFNYWQIIR